MTPGIFCESVPTGTSAESVVSVVLLSSRRRFADDWDSPTLHRLPRAADVSDTSDIRSLCPALATAGSSSASLCLPKRARTGLTTRPCNAAHFLLQLARNDASPFDRISVVPPIRIQCCSARKCRLPGLRANSSHQAAARCVIFSLVVGVAKAQIRCSPPRGETAAAPSHAMATSQSEIWRAPAQEA